MTGVATLLRWLIRGYQILLSPLLPPACRYQPSCSSYAAEALAVHGPGRGLKLTVARLGRCHPWGGHGYDPVPATPAESSGRPLCRR
ncbi:MAG: membrane protein insertion efficiency factor YidD [Alphaproteobacteria bacterium]|jgi:putative membrane protein insertion efficiency factor|nr:membrane protein insertion efficiency factor YidD [Alphaproteobacteria bacterium]